MCSGSRAAGEGFMDQLASGPSEWDDAVPGNVSVLQSATNQPADKQTLVEGAELLSALPKEER